MELVERHGQQRWSLIATYLTGRIGKQCRERWHNHLRPDIKVCTIHTKLKSTCLKIERERERERVQLARAARTQSSPLDSKKL